MKSIDTDNNGYISFEEFLIASINKEKILTEKNLKMAFDVFDRDKSGGISQNELKYILGEYNVNAKEYLWKKMIQQIDLNQDGQISYQEFHEMMMDVINNKNKRLSMEIQRLLLMDNNLDNNVDNYGPHLHSAKQNSTFLEPRPKKKLLELKDGVNKSNSVNKDDKNIDNKKVNKKDENNEKKDGNNEKKDEKDDGKDEKDEKDEKDKKNIIKDENNDENNENYDNDNNNVFIYKEEK
jgi:hypothetical protein